MSCRSFEDGTVGPEPDDFFLQCCNLGHVGPHLPVPRNRGGQCDDEFPHSAAQNDLDDIRTTGSVCNRNAPLRPQTNRVDLERAAERLSCNLNPSGPWSRSSLRVHKIGSRSRSRAIRDGLVRVTYI
jgi:hypothetical protein